MTAKHTYKSPWRLGADGKSVYSLDGYKVASTGPFANRKENNNEAIAAHLIAAAPDLLEALELIVSDDEFCGDDWGVRRDAWIETAKSAIAKAKGE